MENQDLTPAGDVMQRLIENLPKNSPSEEELAKAAARDAEWQEKLRQERIEERRQHLWDLSSIPTRHSHAIRSIPKEGPWYDAYSKIKSEMGRGFIFALAGIRGTGKTQMAVCLISHACHNLRLSRYAKAMEIFIAIRKSYRSEYETESDVIDRYVSPKLLVIDALEERGETSFEDRILNHIIDLRYDNMDDTILITNQTVEAFSESMGPSIVSRIHESGNCVVFDWPTYRKKG